MFIRSDGRVKISIVKNEIYFQLIETTERGGRCICN